MVRIFLSHSSADTAAARALHRGLSEHGHEVFLDLDPRDGIRAGEVWKQTLYQRLRWADVVVCLVSPAYVASQWCGIEVAAAEMLGSRVIPLSMVAGMLHPLLEAVQHEDFGDTGHALDVLAEVLRTASASGGAGWPDGRSPYPGLSAFEPDRQGVFFGRQHDVAALSALLRSPAQQATGELITIVGPSGSGKSSLLRAGLLPAMSLETGWWTVPTFVPGTDPVRALARELAVQASQLDLRWTVAGVQSRLEAADGLASVADDVLVAASGRQRRRRLLIAIDQMEEILTQTAPEQRRRFAALFTRSAVDVVSMVATMRPEFLEPIIAAPDLAGIPLRPYAMRPLSSDALESVITGPARVAGITVEEELVRRLVADTRTGEALPLLAYTLQQLSEGVQRGGQLSTRRYDELGGVTGALTGQADAALAAACARTGRSASAVTADLLRLVTVDDHGRPTRRRVPYDELPADVRSGLDVFADLRLLSTGDVDGQVTIGVTHEAFLTAWPPLANAIAAAGAALRARTEIERAAADWENDEHRSKHLWERTRLANAVELLGARLRRPARAAATMLARLRLQRRALVTEKLDIGDAARRFLQASMRYDRRRRTRSTTVLASLLALALAAAAVAVVMQRNATKQRDAAEQQRRLATARQLIAESRVNFDKDPQLSLRMALAAKTISSDPEAGSNLAKIVTATRYMQTLVGHDDGVYSVAFTGDGATLATASSDKTVRLWDVRDPTRAKPWGPPLTGHTGTVWAVAFTRDGRTLATASLDKTVILWDVSDPAHPERLGQPITAHTDSLYAVAFTRDGHLLATAGLDQRVILWDVTDPSRPRQLGQPLTAHQGWVGSVAFTDDGTTMATGSADRTVILWDIRDPARPRVLGKPLTGPSDSVSSVAFGGDAGLLAVGSYDHTATLWDIRDQQHPKRVGQSLYSGSAVRSVALTRDARMLAVAGADRTIALWDLADPATPSGNATLMAHTNWVFSAAFSDDGTKLASASGDKTAMLWDVRNRPTVMSSGPGAMRSVAIAPDGVTLAAGSADHSVTLWDTSDPRRPAMLGRPFAANDGEVRSVSFSPDGHMLATSGTDKTASLWDITSKTNPRRIGAPLTGHTNTVEKAVFSPDGRLLATSALDRTVRLWDVSDPARPRQLGAPLEGHTNTVETIAFSPDGHTLATGSLDYSVMLWDITEPTAVKQFGEPIRVHTDFVESVVFSPDGKTLASGSFDRTVRLWNVSDPAWAYPRAPALTDHYVGVWSLAWSRTGNVLTSAANDGIISYDVSNPDKPQQIGQPLSTAGYLVVSAAITGDGRAIAGASNASAVLYWDLGPTLEILAHPADHACARAGGGLTPGQWSEYVGSLPYVATCPASQ
ncbi:TIR domain-containing protein [Dactylosporangium sucinum]|uniref:TIR domain-containing protein n=1 Tax=Dactylosporangium sucinum TaxID=1424081 RepID=A0A917UAJ8_9ACTN|nr:TIR domain-containing protein [Dactylosporangium sucinum]GGM71110.1 hypothetical protein GCM10007977_086200 [Dactylosporangium sucinum]